MLVALPETHQLQLIRALEPVQLGIYVQGFQLLKGEENPRSL